jgi:hypothetical protein
VDHVLNELDSLFQSGDLDGEDVVLISPGTVFSFSLSGSRLDGSDGFIVVSVGLFQVSGGLGEYVGVFGNGGFQGGDGGDLFSDLLVEAGD